MDHDVFLRRLGSLDPRHPEREALEAILIDAFRTLRPRERALRVLRSTFDLSYRGHLRAPPRASGEAYIYHILRADLEAIRMMDMFGVFNLNLVLQLTLHDTVEDAREGGYHPLLMRSNVLQEVGPINAWGIGLLTKHDEFGNVKPDYYRRLSETRMWEPVAGKHFDRLDNIRTLGDMPLHKRQKKLEETEREFPSLTRTLFQNALRKVERGTFHHGYLALCGLIASELARAVRVEKDRLSMP